MTASQHPFAFLTEEYTLRTCSTDVNGLWRLSDILVQLQELAGSQCQALGCGRLDLIREHGLVWVLTRTEVRMRRHPSLGERVKITTWAAPPRRMIWPRYFTAEDAEGERIFDSLTQWVLCSITDRKMANVPAIADLIPTPDREPAFTRFTPAPEVSGEARTFSMTPRYSDLDANGHVNNTRYADFLCDALGTEVMKKRRIGTFTVDYRHEILPEDHLDMALKHDDSAFTLSGSRDGTLCFDIGGTFE